MDVFSYTYMVYVKGPSYTHMVYETEKLVYLYCIRKDENVLENDPNTKHLVFKNNVLEILSYCYIF